MITMLTLLLWWCAATAPRPAVDFARDVRPIFEARCQPCHFPGGKMYERLPFDRPDTILKLGEKLFTRIRDEQQQEVIRRFLRSAGVAPAADGRPGRQ